MASPAGSQLVLCCLPHQCGGQCDLSVLCSNPSCSLLPPPPLHWVLSDLGTPGPFLLTSCTSIPVQPIPAPAHPYHSSYSLGTGKCKTCAPSQPPLSLADLLPPGHPLACLYHLREAICGYPRQPQPGPLHGPRSHSLQLSSLISLTTYSVHLPPCYQDVFYSLLCTQNLARDPAGSGSSPNSFTAYTSSMEQLHKAFYPVKQQKDQSSICEKGGFFPTCARDGPQGLGHAKRALYH